MILTFCILFNSFHALYVSVTEIDFDKDDSKLNLKVKIFTNDLEDGIFNQTGQSVSLRTNEQLKSNQLLVGRYINDHLSISVNRTNKPLSLLKSENEGDATWSYLEVDITDQIRSIEVQNQLLTELFETQSNVVSIDINGDKRFLRFTKNQQSELLEF